MNIRKYLKFRQANLQFVKIRIEGLFTGKAFITATQGKSSICLNVGGSFDTFRPVIPPEILDPPMLSIEKVKVDDLSQALVVQPKR